MNMLINSIFGLGIMVSVATAQWPSHEAKRPLGPLTRFVVDRESTHHFDVRYYRLDLNLPMNSGAMTGRCRVELTPRHDNFDTFSLHMVNLVCDSVRRAGNVCSFTTGSGMLRITLDRQFANGESLAVDISYHRNAGTQNRGFYWYARGTQGIPHAVAYSVCEPDDSRYWFPCFDQPWDKAERGCAVNITVPDSLVACANGQLDSVTTGGGTKTYWWTHHYPIATYLMCFAASRFAHWSVWFVHHGDSLPVHYYVWPEDSSLAVTNFGRMIDMLQFFSQDSLYGRYPFFSEKYGMVAVYPYPWGGMEHQTMTTIHRWWARNGSDNGIAHELAHQWWGDMVTCLDWRNIWLNEGFATYSDELYDHHQNGRASFLALIQSRAQDYFEEEASDPHPIYDPPAGHEFDWGHSYCKGAWVQHMLRYVMGDTVWAQPGSFFSGLRAYGDSLRYQNANTDDYRRIQERTAGQPLDWFFNEWVYSMGYPVYQVGWQSRPTQDGWEVVIDLAQDNGAGAPPLFHMPVEVKLQFASGDTLIRFAVTANPQRNIFPVRDQVINLEFDPNEWLLAQHSVNMGLTSAIDPQLGIGSARLRVVTNPCRNRTQLDYALPGPRTVRLAVFDHNGRLVQQLVSGTKKGGRYSVNWDLRDKAGRPIAAGVYLIRLSAGAEQVTGKLVVTD